METRSSNGLSQSLLSQEERKEAGHVKNPAKETFCERYTRETHENKDVCDTFCTRSILSCLNNSKELFLGDWCQDPKEQRPSSSEYSHCEKAEHFCCENCIPTCIGGTCLTLFACASLPFSLFVDGIRSIGRAVTKLKDTDQEPVRRVRFQT